MVLPRDGIVRLLKSSCQVSFIVSLSVALASCGSKLYRETGAAEFSGTLDVRWIENNYFVFVPNTRNPLKLIRSDGSYIEPGIMYTDGGSIPRFLWGIEGYSPWGYAPAYMVHDWLFVAQHCNYEPDNRYTFEDSVSVMSESLKALMEANLDIKNYFAFESIVLAVRTNIARRMWEDGACAEPAVDLEPFTSRNLSQDLPGELIFTIDFGS